MTIWKQIMSNIPANKKSSEFKKPDGLTTAYICPDTGQLAVSGYCHEAYNEYFVKGTEPTTYCSVGQNDKKKAEEKKKREREERERKQREEEEARRKKEEEEKKKAAEKNEKSRNSDDEDDEDDEE